MTIGWVKKSFRFIFNIGDDFNTSPHFEVERNKLQIIVDVDADIEICGWISLVWPFTKLSYTPPQLSTDEDSSHDEDIIDSDN